MRAVQRLVPHPRRQQPGGGQLGLRHPRPPRGRTRDLGLGGVAEAALAPDPHHRQPVGDQRRRAAAPHEDGGVVGPAVVGQLERPQDLQGLHPLLAQGGGSRAAGRSSRSRPPAGRSASPASLAVRRVSRRAQRRLPRARRAPCPTRRPPPPARLAAARAGAPPSSPPAVHPHAQVVRSGDLGQRGPVATPSTTTNRPSSVPRPRSSGGRPAPGGPRRAERRAGRRPSRPRGWAPTLTIATGMPSLAARSTNR